METMSNFYKELKDFKFRVGLEAYNAIQLRENADDLTLTHKVKIGRATFTFYPMDRRTVDKILSRFTTTTW